MQNAEELQLKTNLDMEEKCSKLESLSKDIAELKASAEAQTMDLKSNLIIAVEAKEVFEEILGHIWFHLMDILKILFAPSFWKLPLLVRTLRSRSWSRK